jgi:hypothetical protein
MRLVNRVVRGLLGSPAHRLLSGSTCVVRYRGRRSGTEFSTPTQYARQGDGLVILVGRAEAKQWWRNFQEDRTVDVLVAGRWLPMTGRAVLGAAQPDEIAPLLEAYLRRFPRVERHLPGESRQAKAAAAVVVWCRPRSAS